MGDRRGAPAELSPTPRLPTGVLGNASSAAFTAQLPATRVIAVEHRWLSRLRQASLRVHRLDSVNFTLLDATAGYWVSAQTTQVQDVSAIKEYVDAVVAARGEFSAIRMRNASPRQAADDVR